MKQWRDLRVTQGVKSKRNLEGNKRKNGRKDWKKRGTGLGVRE